MATYEEEYKAMQFLTQQYVGRICRIWEQIFEPDVCKDNLRKLIEHANNFYRELVDESIGRKEFILGEINELKKEADELKRLLHVDVQLPCYESADVPLLRVQSEMDKSLEHLREQLMLRKEEVCELLLQQEALCEELGESPRELLADPLPTPYEIEDFKQHLEKLNQARDERINRVATLRREVRKFLEILELVVTTETEDRLLYHRQIKLNKETFDDLNRLHSKYAAMVQELKDSIDSMHSKLQVLWDRLQTSPNTRHKFSRYPMYNQNVASAMYNELQRCEQLKKQNIKLFVEQIREEMREWWDKCLKSEKERERFSNYTCNTYTDDLLILHEMELNELKMHYKTYKHIYDLYANRNILWERMSALEAKSSDPGRYNNRGGQLLKEEKERKIIATKLPKIEQEITELVEEYQLKEHRPFLVYGDNILDIMADQWEQKRMDKEKVQIARKNALTTSTVKTNTTIRTPMSMRNATSMSSLKKTPSITSLSVHPNTSAKRKLKPADAITPKAKRSLMHALNSPSVYLKPTNLKNSHTPLSLPGTANKYKSSLKKPKPVIGSTIRRRSGRQNCVAKKRRSLNKNTSGSKITPKIVVQRCSSSDEYSTDQNPDDTYESFQKCIEPASRSSIIHDVSGASTSSRIRRMQRIVADENERIAKLPRPPTIRTPSRQNLYTSTSHLARSPNNNHPHNQSNMASSTRRKLTTKNLPIII